MHIPWQIESTMHMFAVCSFINWTWIIWCLTHTRHCSPSSVCEPGSDSMLLTAALWNYFALHSQTTTLPSFFFIFSVIKPYYFPLLVSLLSPTFKCWSISGFVQSLSIFFQSPLSPEVILPCLVIWDPYADISQICLASFDLFPELQAHPFNSKLDISILGFTGHLKLNMTRRELLISFYPHPPSPPLVPLSILPVLVS